MKYFPRLFGGGGPRYTWKREQDGRIHSLSVDGRHMGMVTLQSMKDYYPGKWLAQCRGKTEVFETEREAKRRLRKMVDEHLAQHNGDADAYFK